MEPVAVAVRRIELILEELETIKKALENGVIPRGVSLPRRQLDVIAETLSRAEKWVGAEELAESCGLSASGVRAILYANQDRFEARHLSPRRVQWRTRAAAESVDSVVSDCISV